ncbi:MAG: hypothetical protein BGO55_24005 [Sphingobacteriales bacterium 50-39]|nr:hypothetical protein [Sphingobacteriales bacterium]OJW58364.1 MAG: hypothetical protein BGO55_24005 [Sphingobacteriales bacterium 50-39]
MEILSEDCLSLLPADLVKKAGNMSKAYQYLYCLENLVRMYIDEHPSRQFIRIPSSCQKMANGRKDDESKHKWSSLRGNSDLYYLDFKDLSGILTYNWEHFSSDFPTQSWIAAKLEDMARCRNLIAHNSYLLKDEQDLIRVHFNLITRQLGLNKLRIADKETRVVSPEKGFVDGLKRFTIWTHQQASKGADFSLEYPASLDVAPVLLQAFYNQTSIAFYIVFENARVPIFPNFETGRRKDIAEERWLKDNVLFQVGQYDIDQDGIDEIFICLQDYQEKVIGGGIEIKVFKYYPPAFRHHAFRAQNWELVGDFPFDSIGGEPKAYIHDTSIKVPRNLRGFFYQWTYSEGQFRNTGFW